MMKGCFQCVDILTKVNDVGLHSGTGGGKRC